MKLAIIGADGQLGCDVMLALHDLQPVPLTENEIDVTNKDRVASVLANIRPDCVINTAAFTDVDRCETEEKRAFAVNALGAKHVAESCDAIGATIVHISTDYVFNGRKNSPYRENDTPAPINIYGATKRSGEVYIQNACANHYIVRTSGLYGMAPCIGKGGKNFVDTMLGLAGERDSIAVVSDEVLSPTFTEDLAAQLRVFLDGSLPAGIYHATSEGSCSWFEFAKTIFEMAEIAVRLEETTSAKWGAPAKRPAFSVLENAKLLKHLKCTMPHWGDALQRYLKKKGALKTPA